MKNSVSELESASQPFSDFFCRQPGHSYQLAPAAQAGGYGNGGPWNLQKIREELDTCRIGFPLQGWSSQRYFQRVTEFAGDRIFPGARVNFDCEPGAVRSIVNGDHENRFTADGKKATAENPNQ
jgi:hypothetical protein